MEWSLEDLFAEPPPKVTEDSCGVKESNDLERSLEIAKAVSPRVSPVCPTGCENVENGHIGSNESAKESNEAGGCETVVLESNKTFQSPKRYHVPKLEDVLAFSKKNVVREERISFERKDQNVNFQSYKNSVWTEDVVSEKKADNGGKDIREAFKERFKAKDSIRVCGKATNYPHGTLKRKFDTCGISGVDDSFEAKNSKDGNLTQGSKQKKKKAGNYQRKLHTKCRISAKEIQKVTNQKNEYYQDFFGDISERSTESETSGITATENNKIFPTYGSVTAKNFALSGVQQKSTKGKIGKKRSKKKWKNKKGNYKLHVINGRNPEDVDCVVNSDDIILSPGKDVKPHKWPVCKHASKTKSIKFEDTRSEQKNETKCDSDPDGENSFRTTNERGGVDTKNLVLDSILQDVSSRNEVINEGKEVNKNIITTDNDIEEFCANLKPCGANKTSFQSLSEHVNLSNKGVSVFASVEKQEKINGTFINEKEYILREGTKKIHSDEDTFVSDNAQIKLDDVIRKRNHKLSNDKAKCCKKFENGGDENGWTPSPGNLNINENSKKINNNRINGKASDIDDSDDMMIDCDGDDLDFHDGKSYDCIRTKNHNGIKSESQLELNCFDKGRKVINPCENLRGCFNRESLNFNERMNVQSQESQVPVPPNSNQNASLLSSVSALPVDLSVVGKDETQLLPGKRKRGGRKKKGKKNTVPTNVGNNLRMKIEEKAKVQCKFFLEGKCNKGAECRFLHEGIPQRRELCRYYVTDCCLADGCIFMHSEFPCKFFHSFAKCVNGSKCKYSHEPLTEETKKLLDELLAREVTVKKEDIAPASQQSSDATAEELIDNIEADQTCPSLFSSLI